jgi:hypothetical protein
MKPSNRTGFLELEKDDVIQPGDVIYLSFVNAQIVIDSRSVIVKCKAGAFPNTVFQRQGSMQLPSSWLNPESQESK